MSYMEVHKVPAEGEIETLGEFRNAHRGAMLIWRAMCRKYLGLEHVPFDESKLDPLWKLSDDETVPYSVRLVHGSTFDKVMARRENLGRLADAMDFFAETVCPEDSGHLKPHAGLLREAAKDASIFAVCWTQTSVSDDIWKIWEDEDDVRYYDVSRDEGHWFLFDKVKPVANQVGSTVAAMNEVADALRKYLPPEWDVRLQDGRVEVREWAGRPAPLFNFDGGGNAPADLLAGLPEIIGAMIAAMHREFCGLREFAKEAVAGCAELGSRAEAVVARVKSTPISWELPEGILDAFLGPDRAGEPILLGLPCPRCNGTGRADRVPSVSNIGDPCRTCDGTGFVPE